MTGFGGNILGKIWQGNVLGRFSSGLGAVRRLCITCPPGHCWYITDVAPTFRHQPIPAQLAHLHWSSGHDFRLSRVKSRQARETGVRFPDGELILLLF